MKPTAKFRIEGEDATALAFRSVLGNAQSAANRVQRVFSLAFQSFAGFGALQGVRKIIDLNIQSSDEFARSIQGVKSAWQDLFTLDSSGMSSLVEQMDRLAETLRDPDVRDGAETLTGFLLAGGTKVVEGWSLLAGQVAGLGKDTEKYSEDLEDAWAEQSRLNAAIEHTAKVMAEIRRATPDNHAHYDLAAKRLANYRKELREVEAEIGRLMKAHEAAVEVEEVRVLGRRLGKKESTSTARLEELAEVEVKAQRIRTQAYFEDLDRITQTTTERQVAQLERLEFALEELFDAGLISAEQFNERWDEIFGETIHEVEVIAKKIGENFKEPVKELPAYAMQAADDARYAFENFFFEPTIDGIKDLGRELVDTLRAAIARGLADKLFNSKAEGGFGWGDIIGGAVSGIGNRLGFADGGSFRVGGSGGTDSTPVKFWATPGEIVDIRKPGQAGGNITIAPVYNIDARGATTDLVKVLPALLEANNRRAVDMARAALKDDISRGRMR